MIYRVGITTNANTSKSNAKQTTVELTKGTIHQIDIHFPAGCMGLVHCTINRALHQVWPSNANEDFAADNINIRFKEDYPVDLNPYELQIFTWNDDDTYNHTIIVRIGLLRHKTLLERFL